MVFPWSRTCVDSWSFLCILIITGGFMILGKEKEVYASPGEGYSLEKNGIENSMGEGADGAAGQLGGAILGYSKLKEVTEKERRESIERVIGGTNGAEGGSENRNEDRKDTEIQSGSLLETGNESMETMKESRKLGNATWSTESIRKSDIQENVLPVSGAEADIRSGERKETHFELHSRIAAALGRMLAEMQKLHSEYSHHTMTEEGMKTSSRETEVLAKIQEILDLGSRKQNTDRIDSAYSQSGVSANLDHSTELPKSSHVQGGDRENDQRDPVISGAEHLPYASKVDTTAIEPTIPGRSSSSDFFHDDRKGTGHNCHGNCILKRAKVEGQSDEKTRLEARVHNGKLSATRGISAVTTVLAGVAVISAIGLLIAGFAHTYTAQFTISPAPLHSPRGPSLV